MSFGIKVCLGMLVVAALSASTFFFFPRTAGVPRAEGAPPTGRLGTFGTSSEGDPYAALVTYTENGFEPSRIEIERGQSVRFLNGTVDKEIWPASTPYPTHSDYPERSLTDCLGSSFDACASLPPGTWWQFQFDQPGVWGFYDYLDPSETGTVVVSW